MSPKRKTARDIRWGRVGAASAKQRNSIQIPTRRFITKLGTAKCCCTTGPPTWTEECEVFSVPLPDTISMTVESVVDGLCDCGPFNGTFEIDVQGDYGGFTGDQIEYCFRTFRINAVPWDITVNFYCSQEAETRAILVSMNHKNGGMCYPNCMAYSNTPMIYFSYGGLTSLTPNPLEWESATGPWPSASGTETYTATKMAGGCGCGVGGTAIISWGA